MSGHERTWNVLLDGAASGYVASELPSVRETINVGGALALVEEILTGADGEPLIVARRLPADD